MFNPEMIVYLWFVPVVLFIIIPLSVLCFWGVYQLSRKITDRIELAYKSTNKVGNQAPVSSLRPRPAI